MRGGGGGASVVVVAGVCVVDLLILPLVLTFCTLHYTCLTNVTDGSRYFVGTEGEYVL